MVAPSGKTKLDTERFTPSSSSQVLIETGRVAALDEVLNATIKGRAIRRSSVTGVRPVVNHAIAGNTIKP